MATHFPTEEDFSDYEKVYLQMSRAFKPIGKEHWSVHCVCKLSSDEARSGPTELNVRNAWKCLALDYPGLTVRPVNFTKQSDMLDEVNLNQWEKLTFTLETNRTADEVIGSAVPSDLPSLYFLPVSQELVFLSQHWRTDALGCCIILNRLVQHLSAQTDPAELLKLPRPGLSPCLETAAGSSFDVDEEIQKYASDHIDQFHAKAVQSGGLPYQGDKTTPPGCTKHRELALSADATTAVVKSCKALGISVSSAIHVALARTYFSFIEGEEEKQKGYTTVMAVNARPYLQSPYSKPSHACQTYVASIIPTVQYDAGFADAARDLTHQYRTWCSEKLLKSLCWAYKCHLEKLFTPPAGGPPKPPSGVTLSSLGVVDQHFKDEHGHIAIDGFRFGVSMMTRQTLLYAWTFRGQLTLSLDYNEAYYSEDVAQQVLDRVRGYLYEGLGLQEQC